MLILSRKVGETIQIGDDILVRVVKNEGGEVKIGIEAPRHIQITRDDAKIREPRRDRE